jgi:hypothetical protein
MRPALYLACALSAVAGAAAAQTAYQAPAPVATPTPTPTQSEITTPVPRVDPNALTPTQQRRLEALYGQGWQYRMAPISPGQNADVPINPAQDVQPADLANLDRRLKADEIIMTAMRDSELARENAVIASIEPGLPYTRPRRQTPNFVNFLNFPDFKREIDWFKERF